MTRALREGKTKGNVKEPPKSVKRPSGPPPAQRATKVTLGEIMSEETLVEEIEAIRKINNANWMHILRIALRVAPKETKEVLSKIAICDSEIQKRLKELAGGKD